MAYQPSKRGSGSTEPLEINMFPMMNLMVVLVPLLLSTATAIKIGVIELNLPQATGGPLSQVVMPKEVQQTLDLTVTVTDEGFYISSSRTILDNPSKEGPTLPVKEDGSYPYEKLTDLLLEIKKKVIGTSLDTKRVILQAEGDIDYQTIVSTMDAARSFRIDDEDRELFPEVTISAGIL